MSKLAESDTSRQVTKNSVNAKPRLTDLLRWDESLRAYAQTLRRAIGRTVLADNALYAHVPRN